MNKRKPSDKGLLAAGLLVVIVGLCAILILLSFDKLPIYVDDALITYRYSCNLAQGKGAVFNENERVEGYTNFLWMLILSFFCDPGDEYLVIHASTVLGIVFTLGALIVHFLLCRLLMQGNALYALLPVLLLGVNGAYWIWALCGLEGPMFIFWVLLGLYLLFRKQSKGSPLAYVFLFLASLTRPEGLIFALLSFLYPFKLQGSPRVQFSSRKIVGIAIFLVPYLAYYIWRYYYYGYLLPNTFYAKTGGGWHQMLRGAEYILDFLHFYGLPLLIILAGYLFYHTKKAEDLFISLLCMVYFAYIIYIGGDWMPFYRFLAPVLPLLYLLGGLGFRSIMVGLGKTSDSRWLALVIAVILAIYTLLPALNSKHRDNLLFEDNLTRMRIKIGKYLKANASPDAVIAIGAVGAIPYFSGLKTIDMLGLVDEHIAHTKNLSFGSAGHEKGDPEYIFNRKPDYIFQLAALTDEPKSFDEFVHHFRNHRYSKLYNSEHFKEFYRLENMPLDGRFLTYFKLKSVQDRKFLFELPTLDRKKPKELDPPDDPASSVHTDRIIH